MAFVYVHKFADILARLKFDTCQRPVRRINNLLKMTIHKKGVVFFCLRRNLENFKKAAIHWSQRLRIVVILYFKFDPKVLGNLTFLGSSWYFYPSKSSSIVWYAPSWSLFPSLFLVQADSSYPSPPARRTSSHARYF